LIQISNFKLVAPGIRAQAEKWAEEDGTGGPEIAPTAGARADSLNGICGLIPIGRNGPGAGASRGEENYFGCYCDISQVFVVGRKSRRNRHQHH
jgi:hypothetical protein